jgi:hypothetical protein
MKLSLMVLLTLIFSVTMTCSAEDNIKYKIEGLNDDKYYTLCGVWEERKVIDEDELDWAVFTWGKSKYTQDSIIIDFGYKRTTDMWYDPPAIFMVGDKAKKILSIELINERKIILNLEGLFWDDDAKREVKKIGNYMIHINDDGTIWIDYNSSKKYVKRILYKISGPNRPTK